MSLASHKVTDAQIAEKGVIAAPDVMLGTAAANKAVFDRLIREAVKGCINGLIDELAEETAAEELGAVDPDGEESTVQDELDAAYRKPDDGIPSSDLASAVQALLTLAGTAYQKPATGIPKTDMASAVQTLLDLAGTAYQKAASGIPKTDLATDVQTSLGKADSALQEHQSLAAYRTSAEQDVIDAGKGTYSKPDTGIPESDLAYDVATKLNLPGIKWATYGSTSASQINTWAEAGYAVFVKKNAYIYILVSIKESVGPDYAKFARWAGMTGDGAVRKAVEGLYVEGTTWETVYFDVVSAEDYDPITKTSAMTQAVGKDSSGRLWTTPGSSSAAVWGQITGDLADQTDLAQALPNAGRVKELTIGSVKYSMIDMLFSAHTYVLLAFGQDNIPFICEGKEETAYIFRAPFGMYYDVVAGATSADPAVWTLHSNSWDNKYDKPASGIPGTDLSAAVQESLGNADTAYQKPADGIPKTDMTQTVQRSLDLADGAPLMRGTFGDLRYNASTIYHATYRYAVFGEIKPNDYSKPCHVKIRYKAHDTVEGYESIYGITDVDVWFGNDTEGSSSYAVSTYTSKATKIQCTKSRFVALQYFSFKGLTPAGIANEASIPFGTAIYTSMTRYTTDSRDVTVEVLEADDCTVTLKPDTDPTYCVAVADFVGDGESADYNAVTDLTITTVGDTHTGDANTTYTLNNLISGVRVIADNGEANENEKKIYYYRFCPENTDGLVEGLSVTYNAAVTNLTRKPNMHLHGKLGGQLTYYSSTTAKSPGTAISNKIAEASIDARYNFSTNASGNLVIGDEEISAVSKADVFIKAKISADGTYWYLDSALGTTDISDHLTTVLPTTDDGYVYIQLCRFINSKTNVELRPEHPMYYYKGGKICLYTGFDAYTKGETDAMLTAKQDKATTATINIAVEDWNGGTSCTKICPGATNTCIAICDSSDTTVECTAQGAGTLTFTATATPGASVTVKVVIIP